ncbi:MAG TPA: hypothetical protein VHO91_15915 [Rhodopila sp.]|nr:hypothetical protein [Rhodopila sp.]
MPGADATNRSDRKQDKTIEDTFPASDPPANSGVTGAGVPDKPSAERNEQERPTGRPTSDRHATETAHQWEHEDESAGHKAS